MNEVMKKAERLIEKAAKKCSRMEEVRLYPGYAEDGYDDPASGVIATGNWNTITKYNEVTRKFDVVDDTPAKLAQKLEKLGVELEWSDEWTDCMECGKLIRTSPNSYGWQPSYSYVEGEGYICLGCLKPEDHLRQCVENNKGNQIADIDPADHGYIKLEGDFENGWYGGQCASPDIIMKAMIAADVPVLLNLDDVGQFDMRFSVWIHKKAGKKKIAKAREVLANPSNVNLKEDPKDVMSRALKSVPVVTSNQGDGIQCTQIKADGTVSTRIVSPQEFVDGIKRE